MQAARLHEIGGPRNVRLDEVPEPQPSAGEVVVRVDAAALNHRDVFITQGLYPNITLPRTLGSDGCGVVETQGSPLHGRRVVIDPMLYWGDDARVWSSRAEILGMPRDGTFAGAVCVPGSNVYAAPDHLDGSECAALPLAGLTAYRAIFTRGAVRAGETVLVTGVGGGVATFALLFAKAAGARVLVTSGSDEKLERARAMGADVTVNAKTDAEWHKTLRRAVGAPIDVAIDSVGGETFARVTTILTPGGRVVTYGGTTGDAKIKMFPIFWNHLTILGTSMGSPQDFQQMLALVVEHRLRPVVDRVYPLAEAPAALERLAEAEQFGKVVLAIR